MICRILDLYFSLEGKHAEVLSASLVTTVQNNAAQLTILREKERAIETAIHRGIPERLMKLTAGLYYLSVLLLI